MTFTLASGRCCKTGVEISMMQTGFHIPASCGILMQYAMMAVQVDLSNSLISFKSLMYPEAGHK